MGTIRCTGCRSLCYRDPMDRDPPRQRSTGRNMGPATETSLEGACTQAVRQKVTAYRDPTPTPRWQNDLTPLHGVWTRECLQAAIIVQVLPNGKGKAIDFTSPRTGSGKAVSLMRQFQMEQFQALLKVEENSEGKTTRHLLCRVKDIPHAAQSRTQAIAVRGERVTTAQPSLCWCYSS